MSGKRPMMRKTAFFIVILCLPAAAQKEFPELLARVAVYEIGTKPELAVVFR